MDMIHRLTREMIVFYEGNPEQIQHFIKVHSFAKLIGESEGLNEQTLFILEAAALVHDIGIKPAMKKYGKHSGNLQEKEGPAPAKMMLTALGFEKNITDRICYLVGHHHTYTEVDGMDYRILLEADFLVNLYEGRQSQEAVTHALQHVFQTKTGTDICRTMFRFQVSA